MNSIEVRWFFNNQELKKIAEEWFMGIGGKLNDPEVRTDFYLPKTCNSTLGIKLRSYDIDTNIEIKEKINQIDIVELKDIGRVEQWNKWSFNINKSDESVRMIAGEKVNWIKIEKSRSTVKYEILPGNKYRIIDTTVDSACIVELTDIKTENKSFWTLGFETFRMDENNEKLLENLKLIFNKIITHDLLQILKPEISFSYPGFIDRLQA